MVCVRCRPGVSLPTGSEWPVTQVTEEGIFPQKLPQRTLARLPSVPMRASGVHVPHLHQEQGRMGGVHATQGGGDPECMHATQGGRDPECMHATQGGGDPECVRFLPVSADTFVCVHLGVGLSGPWGKR